MGDNRPMKLALAKAALVFLFLASPRTALAESYPIPMDKVAATISVPDSWNPNSSDLGLDAVSPDNKLFFSIYVAADEDEKGVLRGAATIAANGDVMKIDLDSVKEATVRIGKIMTSEYAFAMSIDGRPGTLAINLAPLKTGGYLQIIRWGDIQSAGQNASGVNRIFNTLKLTGK